MAKMMWAAGCSVALVALTGCPSTTLTSEGGQIRFETEGVTQGAIRSLTAGPVLVGTRVCADVCREGAGDCAEAGAEAVDRCFTASAVGEASLDGDCLVVEGPGAMSWAFEPVACAENAEGWALEADQLSFVGVAASEAEARIELPYEEALRDLVAGDQIPSYRTTDASGGVPDDVAPGDGEPYRILVGGEAQIFVVLEDNGGAAVMWPKTATVRLLADEGGVPEQASIDGSAAIVSPEAVGAGSVTLEVGETLFEAGTWEAVEASEAASIEIIVAIGEDGEAVGPVAARAVVRDEAGNPLFGAPVEWGVAKGGELSVEPMVDNEGRGDRSYVNLDGGRCLAPDEREGDHEAVLQARFGKLHDEVELQWHNLAPEDPDQEWSRPAECLEPVKACGCDSSGGLAPGWALVGALGWLVRRRGRR